MDRKNDKPLKRNEEGLTANIVLSIVGLMVVNSTFVILLDIFNYNSACPTPTITDACSPVPGIILFEHINKRNDDARSACSQWMSE